MGENAPLAPVYEKIFKILTTPGRDAGELTDEGMGQFLASLRIGEGEENESGQSQIDTRIIALEEEALVKSSKAFAKALVRAIYKRTQRRYEIDNKSGKESLFAVSEDGNRTVENQSDSQSSRPDLDGDYDWDANNPMEAAKSVFFENFTADQLKIVHQQAINADVSEKSSEEIIEEFSLNDLGGIPVIAPGMRGGLLSIPEMAANSDNQGSQADQMISMSGETSDSAIQKDTSSIVDVRPIAAFIKWVADTVEPLTIDEIVRASSASVSQDSDALFDLESKFYASKGIVVKNNFDNKKIIEEIELSDELSDEQRENLSVAYSNILNSIRNPEDTVSSLQEAFTAIAQSFGDNGTAGFMALEDSQITNQKNFKQALNDAGVSKTTQDLFQMYIKDALKQTMPDHKVTVINLMSEHLRNEAPKVLTTMRDKIESILVETGAIDSLSTAPGQKPDASMMLDRLPDTLTEITETTVELEDNMARGLGYALSQDLNISDEQAARNFETIQKFFPDSLPGAHMSAVALERIGKFLNESEAEGAEFGKRLHEHLANMLVARDEMGLPPIAFDISNISSDPGTITRGQFIPSEGDVGPMIQINPNFYLGEENDVFGKPYPFTGDVQSDVLMTVSMHEIFHGVMEEPLRAYENAKSRGEESPIQETIDLIDEVIRAVDAASQSTKFSSIFTGDYSMARREILNRVWNRRDFAEFLSTIEVSPELRRKIDQNGEGFIRNLLDALYAAYLKLLDALGINTEGTALKALLDLSKQLDSIHRELQATDSNYQNQVTDTQMEAIAAMAEQPATALYSKLVQVLNKPKDLPQLPQITAPTQPTHKLPPEQVSLLLQGGLRVVDAKLIKSGNQNYEFYLVEGINSAGGKGFFQAAIQQQGEFAGNERSQSSDIASGQSGLQGLGAVRGMGKHMQEWTSRYGDIYMGSYNSEKSDSYARILARLGFIVDEDLDNNWGRPTEEGKFLRIRQSEEMKANQPQVAEVAEVEVVDDPVAISQRINQLTKGNPKKKIPGLIRQAMQDGNNELAEKYKKELGELKKKQVKKTGFKLPEQAEAEKWPELLIKAGVTKAELDATIGPLLSGKEVLTKVELAEIANIADQSRLIAESMMIETQWRGYSDNRKNNIFKGTNPEYIEILTYAPQFSPLSGFRGIANEEMGDEQPVQGWNQTGTANLDSLKQQNLLSSYDLMLSAGLAEGELDKPTIVQQIRIRTQYVPKQLVTSQNSILGSSDPRLSEISNGHIKISLWGDGDAGKGKMYITISNTQIEEAAQKAQVGGIGNEFGDEYQTSLAFLTTGRAMNMWVNELEFIEDSHQKLFDLFKRHKGAFSSGPLFIQQKLDFEKVKGNVIYGEDIIHQLKRYKDKHELEDSKLKEFLINNAVNFKKEGGNAPQIKFLQQTVIQNSLSNLSASVRQDIENDYDKTLEAFASSLLEQHDQQIGYMQTKWCE